MADPRIDDCPIDDFSIEMTENFRVDGRQGEKKPVLPGRLPTCVGYALLAATILWALVPAHAWSSGQAATTPASAFVQGKLDVAIGGVKIATSTGAVTVTSGNPSLLHTLQDSRLNGREVRLEGERKPDGSFEVHHLFTVHDGKLFRLRYYCHVCNIPAMEPGNCVCCQRPTVLDEIPADEVSEDTVLVP